MTDWLPLLNAAASLVVIVGGVVALVLWLTGRLRLHEEAHLESDTGVALLLTDLAGRNAQLRLPATEIVRQIGSRESRVRPKIEAWEKSAIHGNPLSSTEVGEDGILPGGSREARSSLSPNSRNSWVC